MTTFALSENWLMASGRDIPGGSPWDPAYMPAGGWKPVTVPTTVQAELVKAGVVASPWKDWNIKGLERFERDTWWFRREFVVPETDRDSDRFELEFQGVSLFATVWLNGSPVGFLHNAHIAHRLDVTRYINRAGGNVLAIECSLAYDEMRKRIRTEISGTGDNVRSYVRLCQMSFGWDFAPRLVVIGPWRPVNLICHKRAAVETIFVNTRAIEAGAADLSIEVRTKLVQRIESAPELHLSILENEGTPPVWEHTCPIHGDGRITVEAHLPSARLWYPAPLGEPFRYYVKATVSCDGEIVSRKTARFGIRTVELKQNGQFTFCINGVDVFARGANWVPSNSLTLDSTPERYRHLLELAHEAHFNMLRVWGGGIYEPEVFYDLCDELGIMVWQDFMYACAMYPDDDTAFMENATREAIQVVTRLRCHPSVVLWCGNNECQEAWTLGDWPDRAPRHFGERLYDHVLPDTVRELSPGIPYWPGSPYGGPTTRSREVGDFHDWYSFPNWRDYDKNAPLFSSEYGFRSVPSRETVNEMMSGELQWDGNSPLSRPGSLHKVWQFHHGWCGWLQSILPQFGDPTSLDEFIMLTQEAQATLMRYAVEVYRRRMFKTSGSLIWQYDDPWPAVTFSLVDHFGRPKAAYFWVKEAHAPVIGMFYEKDGATGYWGISDLQNTQACSLRIRRFTHSGALLGDATFGGALLPNAATCIVESLPQNLTIASPDEEFLYAELVAGGMLSERVYHAGKRCDWRLPAATIEAGAVRENEKRVRVKLISSGYVHFVCVSVGDPAARYSTNAVDLLPGEQREIVIRTQERGAITIRSANAPTLVVEV